MLCGYGFTHLPLSPGFHRLEVNIWRPIGTPEQELQSFLLGDTPSLVSQEPIYESAWKDRCLLLTVATGKIVVEVHVVTRFMEQQGIDVKN